MPKWTWIEAAVFSACVSEIIEGVKRAQQQQHANAAAAASLPLVGSKMTGAPVAASTAVKSPTTGGGATGQNQRCKAGITSSSQLLSTNGHSSPLKRNHIFVLLLPQDLFWLKVTLVGCLRITQAYLLFTIRRNAFYSVTFVLKLKLLNHLCLRRQSSPPLWTKTTPPPGAR